MSTIFSSSTMRMVFERPFSVPRKRTSFIFYYRFSRTLPAGLRYGLNVSPLTQRCCISSKGTRSIEKIHGVQLLLAEFRPWPKQVQCFPRLAAGAGRSLPRAGRVSGSAPVSSLQFPSRRPSPGPHAGVQLCLRAAHPAPCQIHTGTGGPPAPGWPHPGPEPLRRPHDPPLPEWLPRQQAGTSSTCTVMILPSKYVLHGA